MLRRLVRHGEVLAVRVLGSDWARTQSGECGECVLDLPLGHSAPLISVELCLQSRLGSTSAPPPCPSSQGPRQTRGPRSLNCTGCKLQDPTKSRIVTIQEPVTLSFRSTSISLSQVI